MHEIGIARRESGNLLLVPVGSQPRRFVPGHEKPTGAPEDIVAAFFADKLELGANTCDH
ncbi:hypothetical protein [Oligosphaera ethanolica]|jgi:hypothetical protein|uniref:Uncharacterized protein n=1 Tax=Oligosphaera ethanolica TaxID=760260 RepID=A0AAE3VJX6_9BACT|nr:hypothetical protein [Oligosphaera ethanolica]MDQ0291499.1 hypothetical protein [Oligosphaera ethanolica]